MSKKSKVFVTRRILRMKYSLMVVKTTKQKLFYKFSNEIIQPLKVRRTIPLFHAQIFSCVFFSPTVTCPLSVITVLGSFDVV